MSNNFLEKIRIRQKVSIAEIAKQVGVSRQLLWGFEKGKNNISTKVLEKIAKTLNCSVSQILGDESNERLYNNEKEQKTEIPSSPTYPIKDQYLNYAMEIVDEMIDHEFHSRQEKTHILSEVYKIVYEFYENQDDNADFAKELEKKIIANQGVLRFLNKENFSKEFTNKLLGKRNKKII